MLIGTFPGVRDNVIFKFWEDSNNPAITREIYEVAATIESVLQGTTKTTLDQSAAKHSNDKKSANTYLAWNIVYNGWADTYPFEDVWNPSYIIPIGSRSEVVFFSTLLSIQRQIRTILPMYVNVGRFPTYYPHKDGDIFSREEISTWKKLHPDIQKDITLVSQYI